MNSKKKHLIWDDLWSQSWFSLFCGENLTFAASHVVLAEVWEGQEAGRSAVFQNVPSPPVGAIFNQRHQRGPIILELPPSVFVHRWGLFHPVYYKTWISNIKWSSIIWCNNVRLWKISDLFSKITFWKTWECDGWMKKNTFLSLPH